MANKNTIELYSDATIAQKGTESEKNALRAELTSQIDSWDSVYGEKGIESLWYKLGNINLGDSSVRAEITAFIANERKIKGGDAGPEFERRFAILERNMGIADVAVASKENEQKNITTAATKKEKIMQRELADAIKNDRNIDSMESRSLEYSKSFIAKHREDITKLQKDFAKPQPELLILLNNVINEPDFLNVHLLQKAIKKIHATAIVSLLDSQKKGDSDGYFGPLTLKALQDIVELEIKLTPNTTPSADATAKSPVVSAGVPPVISTSSTEILQNPISANKVFYKDGAYYLTGPKSTPTRIEYGEILNRFGIPKEAGENLMISSQYASNFAFLLEAYAQISPENQKNAQEAAKLLETKMASDEVQSGKTIMTVEWEMLYLLKLDGSTWSGPRSGSKAKKLLDIFKSNSTPVDQRAKLTQFAREEFKQYDLVANDIINRKWNGNIGAVSDEYFTKMATDLQGGNAFNTSPEYKILYEKVGATGMALVLKSIKKASAQASEDWEKNSKVYVERFKQQTGFTGNIDAVQLTKARDAFRASSIASVGKKEIMFQYLSKDAGLTGGKSKDSELKTLEGILGVGTLRMSDRAWDITGEAAQFLAIEAIAIGVGVFTAGIGTAAVNTAAFGRNAYRGKQLLEAYNAASKTKKALVWGGRAVGGFGVGFETGAAGVRSLYKEKNMYSKEGYAQSIAMGVVMNGLGLYFISSKAPAFLKFKEGEGFLKNTAIPFTSQVVIEGTSMGAASGMVGAYVFEKGHTWSLEEMGQAILMAALFKGASRVKFSKGPNKEIVAEEVDPNTPPTTPTGTATAERATPTAPNAPRGGEVPTTSTVTIETQISRPSTKVEKAAIAKQLKQHRAELKKNENDIEALSVLYAGSALNKGDILLQISKLHQKNNLLKARIREISPVMARRHAADQSATEATPEATPEATVPPTAPAETVHTTPTFEKYLKNLESKLTKLKEGEKISVGSATITIKNGEYLHTSATGEKVTFPKTPEGLKNLKKLILESTSPEKMLQDSLSKDFNAKVESMIQKEIKVGDQTYRVVKNDAGGFVLEKKGANSGFTPVNEAEFAGFNEAQIDTLLNNLLGKGASKYFDGLFKNPFSAENPMIVKLKDVKLKDVFSEATLKKFPKPLQFLYNHTVGDIMKQLRYSLDLKGMPFSGNGLGKLEVLRTLYTGRSSHGNLWSNAHGGFGSMLPSAWTPSLGILVTTGVITGAELYADNSDNIHNTEDAINIACDEFVNNYFNLIWLNLLGTAIVDHQELWELTKTAGDGLSSIARDAGSRVGADGSPK